MAIEVFNVSYQVCKKSPPDVAGPVYANRRPEVQATVVVSDASKINSVIADNVRLDPGEFVEVNTMRRIGPDRAEVFIEPDL
jgi:hypothetical protein